MSRRCPSPAAVPPLSRPVPPVSYPCPATVPPLSRRRPALSRPCPARVPPLSRRCGCAPAPLAALRPTAAFHSFTGGGCGCSAGAACFASGGSPAPIERSSHHGHSEALCYSACVYPFRSKGIITAAVPGLPGAACALALRRRGRVLVVGAGPDVVLLFWRGHELAPAAKRAEKGCRAGGVLPILLPYCAPPPAHQAALGAPRALPAQPGSGCTVCRACSGSTSRQGTSPSTPVQSRALTSADTSHS